MAIPCTGITVTWNSVQFGEVQDIKVQGPQSLPLARASTWTLDLGTIEIQCLGTANVGTAYYGQRQVLEISAENKSIAWRSDCVYESFQMQGTVNDVARYAVRFKVMDTTGAGSNP